MTDEVKKVPLIVYLTVGEKERLQVAANHDGRTASQQGRVAIREHLGDHPAAVDAGIP